MTAKVRHDLSDLSRKVVSAGPWFVSINRFNRTCEVTSGDCWFPVTRQEAREILLRKKG